MKSEFRNLSLELDRDESEFENDCEDVVYEAESHMRFTDDSLVDPQLERQIAHLMDTITRVGGEVCRLRAEVDGLLEQNQGLRTSFDRLRNVIAEKGQLNMDDFELACDVVQASVNETGDYYKKVAN